MPEPRPNRPQPIFDSLAQLIEEGYEKPIHISVETNLADYGISKAFLLSYRGSEATFNAYRREIERLLQWVWVIKKSNLKTISRNDFETYIQFCQSPPRAWIGMRNVPRFKTLGGFRKANPDWRPFVIGVTKSEHKKGIAPNPDDYALSEKAMREIFAINSSFFNFLIQEGYLEVNPVAQIRQKSKYIRKYQSKQKVRRLSEIAWSFVIETAEMMAKENPAQHERTLFIMTALFAMYLRISELTASPRWIPQMRDFSTDIDGNWWFTTVGKGNKERVISVSHSMLNALKRYRLSLGLTPLPTPDDTRPLITKQRGPGPITSTRHIRSIVQACFDESIHRMRSEGFIEEAEQLLAATVHWLRHTGISEDVKMRPREHVRDDAGHSSSAITDKYIDIELRERHETARDKPIKPYELES